MMAVFVFGASAIAFRDFFVWYWRSIAQVPS